MQILAGSLNVDVPGLLHAGYISACPRTFVGHGSPHRFAAATTAKVIDVPAALALKESGKSGEQIVRPATAQATVSAGPFRPASGVFPAAGLAIAFFFFAYLFGLYFRRTLKTNWLGWIPWALALGSVVLITLVVNLAESARTAYLNHAPPPWRDVAVKEYQDPETATEAILHGLIVNGLAGCSFVVKGLPAIQNEVAFPLPVEDYTPGMAYAQKTYGLDGWGREFKFESLGSGYFITSAGADGVFGTADDIIVETPGPATSWEGRISSLYIRPAEAQPICLLHRVDDRLYRAVDEAGARRLTGNDLFDTFGIDKLFGGYQRDNQPPGLAELMRHKELFDFPGGKNGLFLMHIK